ncbi:MAG: lytic transglycosylase domain-containing protein [Treponema sp.]|jgi:soluble lytic murein transglycosylase|nr:lytic transglycosylase domain-containing protein [Treponema sp.]
MDTTRGEAAKRLEAGDIGFIISAEPSRMRELARLDPSAPFYAGLLTDAAGDKVRAAALFEAALGSPIDRVQREAARSLGAILAESGDTGQAARVLAALSKVKAPDESEFVTLRAAALFALGRYGEVEALYASAVSASAAGNAANSGLPLSRALRFLSWAFQQAPGVLAVRERRDYFFGEDRAGSAYRWAYETINRRGEYTVTGADNAAIAGRLAASSGAYSEALTLFDSARNSQSGLFLSYPALLGDLGRTYAAIRTKQETGYSVFSEWESAVRTGKNSPVVPGSAEAGITRYTLLFYLGRIRRQQGKHEEAAAFFARALELAPAYFAGPEASVQQDACIWYLLSSTLADKPENLAALLKSYVKRWNDDDNFNDILDRLSAYLVRQKKWADLREVFSLIRESKDSAMVARYAYLTGRAVALGYVSGSGLSAADYFNIAYEEGNTSFYYRGLSAGYLGKTVVPDEKGRGPSDEDDSFPNKGEIEFFTKFFEYGAGSYAMPYLRARAGDYTRGELRALSRAFADAGRYLESIQIAGIFMRREGYRMTTGDLKLYYPRPFPELIEKNALDTGLRPAVFYGLIRTESAFIPAIASHAGAVGLAQLMPATARETAVLAKRQGGPDYTQGEIDLTNPEINVYLGAVYLKSLRDELGSPMLALLAYNAGPARIRRFRRAEASLPEDLFIETIEIAETRSYGKQVMAAAAAYGYLYYGMSMHEVVADIFK